MKYGEVKSEVWALLGETSSSTTFSTDRVGDKINDVIKKVARGYVRSKLTSKLGTSVVYRVKSLSFMEGKYTFRVIAPLVLLADYNIGDTTITATTTTYPTTGKLLIWPEIVTYTGKTATTFTGVTGGSVKYTKGEAIIPLYTLPTDCDRPNIVNYISNGEYEVPFQKGYKSFDLTSGTIRINNYSSNDLIQVNYTKKVSDLTSDTQDIIIPNPYGSVIAQLVAWEFANQYQLPALQNLLFDAYTSLQEMYAFYSNSLGEPITKIKPTPYQFSSLKR